MATLNFIKSSSCFFAEADEWRRLCGRSASSALLIVDGQSVKNTDTAFRFAREGAVNVFYWVDGKFGYALSAGIDKGELAKVATAVYDQLDQK